MSIKTLDNRILSKKFFYLSVGVIANLLGLALSYFFKLPVRLNSLGTIFSACMLGPIGGCFVAVVTTLLTIITSRAYLLYLIPTACVGTVTGFIYPRANFTRVQLIGCSFTLCGIAAITTIPFNICYRHGYTGNRWGDALFDMLSQHHSFFALNSILDELLVDFPDIMISVFLTAMYLHLLKHISVQKENLS